MTGGVEGVEEEIEDEKQDGMAVGYVNCKYGKGTIRESDMHSFLFGQAKSFTFTYLSCRHNHQSN
jgi:hypothetical protein